MELSAFTALYNRIQEDPSILLLGQNYLSMGGETDPVWHKLATEFYPELNLPRRNTDYPTLWEAVVKSPADAGKLMTNIVEASKFYTCNDAVAAVTSLRWSILFTSAIDDSEALVATKGCTPVPQKEKAPHPKYFNKNRRYRVNLCGGKDAPPPVLRDEDDVESWDEAIEDRVKWIPDAYLEYYGVLVIDGYRPDYDWLNDENLFKRLRKLPENSVFWFGAPEHLGKYAKRLIQNNIMTVDDTGFFEHLAKHMPELLEGIDENASGSEDPTLYAPLTLNLGRERTIWIKRSEIKDISGDNLCVMTDEVLDYSPPTTKSRSLQFAEFLTQPALPNWNLFTGSKNQCSFYIERDKDKELEATVNVLLKKTTSSRKPLILTGPSNSGKSMTLAHLALRIARRRKYPVIFIRGNLLHGGTKKLKEFISNWFFTPEHLGGERIEKVVVIWDGSCLERTQQDYQSLQSHLFNYNAQVIGSLYTCSADGLSLSQDLSSAEYNRMKRLLASIDSTYVDRLNEIRHNQARVKELTNNSLLYLLQMLFKHSHDEEHKAMSKLLTDQIIYRLNQEKLYAENSAADSLEKYVDNFFATQEAIVRSGIASSYKEKLRLFNARLALRAREEKTAEEQAAFDRDMQISNYHNRLCHSIEKINNVLALAGEFGIALPLKLLLKMLQDDDGSPYISITEETNKIVKILQHDTLLNYKSIEDERFGENVFVSYRNPMEAEHYIRMLYNLPQGSIQQQDQNILMDKETELLEKIINAASSTAPQEVWTVIKLVRQFGPNGHGKLSEVDDTANSNDYTRYRHYWHKIAKMLVDHFPDDPEAILVYAHLTREYVRKQTEDTKKYLKNDIYKARVCLEAAIAGLRSNIIDDTKDDRKAQLDRLTVELCANCQQSMSDDGFDSVLYQSIKTQVLSVFNQSPRRNASSLRQDFSSNNLLDILLNAHDCYTKDSSYQPKADMPDPETLEMSEHIGKMLKLGELIDEHNSWNLLGKIMRIYELLGKHDYAQQLNKDIEDRHSDAGIYLKARMMWRPSNPKVPSAYINSFTRFFYQDHYMIIQNDTPHSVTVPEELLPKVHADALAVVTYLEANDSIIKKTRSARCIEMLLRAKWFLKTGNVMLAEKQHPALTKEEWNEIIDLCNRYHSYHSYQKDFMHDSFTPAYFLKAVYEWIHNDFKQADYWFTRAKKTVRGNDRAMTTDILILCAEGTSTPRTFTLSAERGVDGKYYARILQETTRNLSDWDKNDKVVSRYGIRLSGYAVKYLFDGSYPKEYRQQAVHDGAVRFNLIGPQMNSPQIGGHSDD